MKISVGTLSIFVMLLLSALIMAPAASAQEQDSSVDDARDWLLSQQLDDGGFPGFDGASDPGATTDAIVALVAIGNASDAIAEALDYLDGVADDYAATQGGAAKLALAYSAADIDADNFIQLLNERADEETGAFDEQVFIHATAVLAVASTGEELDETAIDFLIERQIDDGSWAFTGDTDPGMGDTNTTSMVIQAIAQAGIVNSAVIDSAIAYLESAQLDDGSFVYAIGAEDPPLGDSNSTALSIQAMISVGVDENDDRIVAAQEALRGFQNESGALGYREDMPDDNALSTAQGIPAMLNLSLPITAGEEIAEEEVVEDEIVTESDDAEVSDSATIDDRCDEFEQTGEAICHGFRDYWWNNGALPIFGYPMTEEFDEQDSDGNDVIVQYFERTKFVYDIDAEEGNRVWHEPLGIEAIDFMPQTEIVDPAGPCQQPDEADFLVCGDFLTYWNEFGGADRFGMPLTELYGSGGMAVQVFEYARFEHHLGEWPERHNVLLGRIGAEILQQDED